MALRLAEDFAGYFDLADLVSGMWSDKSATGLALDPTGSGRSSPCLIFNEYGSHLERTLDNQTGWTVGFRFSLSEVPPTAMYVLELKESSAWTQVSVRFDAATGKISLWRNVNTLLATSTLALSAQQDYHLEVKTLIANSGGTLEVRIDGATWVSYSGDTHYTGDVGASRVRIGTYGGAVVGAGPTFKIWDFYALDGQAGISGFQGHAMRVDTLYVTGAGSSAQFVPTGAATNHEAVDDTPVHNFDTDFNVSSTVGEKDLFAMGNLPISNVGTVAGLIVVNSARSDDGGTRGVKGKVKSGATEGTATDASVTDAYKKYPYVVETNPNTGVAFTKAEVNSLEAGYEVGT